MYCYQCGKEINKDDKFCIYCGAKQSPAVPGSVQHQPAAESLPPVEYKSAPEYQPVVEFQPPVEYQPAPGYQPPLQTQKKSRKGLWITLISIAAVMIAAFAVYFIFFRNAAPLLTLGRAFSNLNTEIEERFENSPLIAFTMLPDILEDGTITVNADYSTAIFGSWLTADINGTVKLSSNTETRNYALEAQVGAYGQSFDLYAQMNRERLAVRLPIIDGSYYGLRYDTFREDIRVVGNMIGLSDQEMNMIADIVDQINEMMNAEKTSGETSDAFSKILNDFARNINVRSYRGERGFDLQRINGRNIEITITKDALVKLFNELYDSFENDESMRAQLDMYNNPLLQGLLGNYGNINEQSLIDLKDFIKDFENNYSGEIKLLFFIDNDDRLTQIAINTDIEYNGRNTKLVSTFNFGRSVYDEWTFAVSYTGDNNTEDLFFHWTFEEKSGSHINTILIASADMNYTKLISEWDRVNGDFKLAYTAGLEYNELTGKFTVNGTNFRILLDDLYPDESSDSLVIEIFTETGAQFNEINFINIDKWGNAIIDAVMSLILGGIIS